MTDQILQNSLASFAMCVVQAILIGLLHSRSRLTLWVGRTFVVGWFLPTFGLAIVGALLLANREPLLFGWNENQLNTMQNSFAFLFLCWLTYVKYHQLYDYITGGSFEEMRSGLSERETDDDNFATSLRLALRMFPDGGVVLVNREKREITECNTRFAEMLGYSFASDVIGRNPKEFTAEPDKHDTRIDEAPDRIDERPVRCIGRNGEFSALLTVIRIDANESLVRIRAVADG